MFHVEQQPLNELVKFLSQRKIVLDQNQIGQLGRYASLLYDYSGRMSLVSASDRPYLVYRHFLECFVYVQHLASFLREGMRLADIGTGAGLPGVILSVMFPQVDIVLVESVRKKTLFLKKIKEELALSYTVINSRIEKMADDGAGIFDVVTARALAAIPLLVKYAFPLLRRGGQLHVIKGLDYKKELDSKTPYELAALGMDDAWVAYGDYLAHRKYIIIRKADEDGI